MDGGSHENVDENDDDVDNDDNGGDGDVDDNGNDDGDNDGESNRGRLPRWSRLWGSTLPWEKSKTFLALSIQ